MESIKKEKIEMENEFKELAKPVNEWLQKNFPPHSRIIIEYDNAEVVIGDMVVPFKILD